MSEKFEKIIDTIKHMDFERKIGLAIRMNESVYTQISYDRPKLIERFNNMLDSTDKKLGNSFTDYTLINFTMAQITELDKEEQNRVLMYLVNICVAKKLPT